MQQLMARLNLEQYKPLIDEYKLRLKPIINYWKRLTLREQQLIIGGGIILCITIICLTIDSCISYAHNLAQDNMTFQQYVVDANTLANEYKVLSNTSPSDFSTITLDRVKADVKEIFGSKNPDVTLVDTTLSIKETNVKFDNVMLLLDELRKSYGLFPDTLKITRLSQSGYVSFKATFQTPEQ